MLAMTPIEQLQDGVPSNSGQHGPVFVRDIAQFLRSCPAGSDVVQAVWSEFDNVRQWWLSGGVVPCHKYAEFLDQHADEHLGNAVFVIRRPDGFTAAYWFVNHAECGGTDA